MHKILPTLSLLIHLALPGRAEDAPQSAPVAPEPLRFGCEFDAILIPKPKDSQTLYQVRHQPEAWTSFTVINSKGHGEKVKKGESIIDIDLTPLSRAIEDQEQAVNEANIALRESKQRLAKTERDHAIAKERAERNLANAKDDYDFYLKVRVPLREENADQVIISYERRLENQREELRQLTAMYEEDGLTEETEEIILQRARNSVADAEFSLKKVKIDDERSRSTTWQRNDLEEKLKVQRLEEALNDLINSQKNELERMHIAVTKSETALARQAERLAQLRRDLDYAAFTAPFDGVVIYGAIRDGHWALGEAAKRLQPGASLNNGLDVFTLVPPATDYQVSAQLSHSEYEQAKHCQTGIGLLGNLISKPLSLTLDEIPFEFSVNQKIKVTFDVNQSSPGLQPLAPVKVKLNSLSAEPVISLPIDAVKFDSSGTPFVKVKKANSDSTATKAELKLGRQGEKRIEILQGLEVGDIVP